MNADMFHMIEAVAWHSQHLSDSLAELAHRPTMERAILVDRDLGRALDSVRRLTAAILAEVEQRGQ